MTKYKMFLPLAAIFWLVSCVSSPAPAPQQEEKPAATAPKSDARNRAQELITGEKPASQSSGTTGTAPEATTTASTTNPALTTAEAPKDEAPPELSPKEKQFFENYLKRLKYMMVVKDGAAVTEFQKRSMLTKGNEVLLKQGYDVVQYDQLLKNIEDQRAAYEAEAGASMSITQYIAQKLGADVYVELDCVPRSSTENNRHYGEANFTANMYDPSTAELLGSVTFRTDRSISTSSQEDALLNALTAGTAQLMPRIIRDSTTVLRNRYANGIRYQVIIQRTPDSRAVSTFRRNLRSRVREIVMGPSAADQTIMDVYFFGSLSDLEDACYSAFEKTPGMESAYWVYTRGKTITFNTGT
ncbi:DUF6175 family protein [Gracilinema caldarium]|uniref:DUF6175 family protein n=1 Tax=Gracilinema caldarium TaxID=215591 RepID=UPI0026E94413|nr:DUF6175 family protein [Gracilinema caldarium]